MRSKALMTGLLLAAAWNILGGANPVLADAHGDRQAVMRANSAAINAIDALVIGALFPDKVKAQAQILIDNGARITTLFGPGTDQNDPGALPVIWTDQVGFKAADEKFIADARAFLGTDDRVDFARALKAVQADCAACHRTYRLMPPPAAGRGRGAPPEDQ
jgi:cytochrome c556